MTDTTDTPTRLETDNELRRLADHDAPFTTVVLDAERRSDAGVVQRWKQLRPECEAAGAPRPALDAIELHLSQPVAEGVGGIYVCASSDGLTFAEVGEEGPHEDFFHVGELPYFAPVLEWEMWRVPHLVVRLQDPAAVFVVLGRRHEVVEISGVEDAVRTCRALADENGIELIVIGDLDDAEVPSVMAQFKTEVPVDVDVRVTTEEDIDLVGDLANDVVRQVADHVARRTVRRLEDFRFLLEHDGAVQGVEPTLDALSRGWGDLLLVHDDPTDTRTAWIGPSPTCLSPTPVDGWREVRLVDGAIAAALACGIAVQIVPTTGPQGPNEDIGLLKTQLTAS